MKILLLLSYFTILYSLLIAAEPEGSGEVAGCQVAAVAADKGDGSNRPRQ